jgi:hypothetical protein
VADGAAHVVYMAHRPTGGEVWLARVVCPYNPSEPTMILNKMKETTATIQRKAQIRYLSERV